MFIFFQTTVLPAQLENRNPVGRGLSFRKRMLMYSNSRALRTGAIKSYGQLVFGSGSTESERPGPSSAPEKKTQQQQQKRRRRGSRKTGKTRGVWKQRGPKWLTDRMVTGDRPVLL